MINLDAIQYQADRVILSYRWYKGDLKKQPGVMGEISKATRKGNYLLSLHYLERVLMESWDFLRTYKYGY